MLLSSPQILLQWNAPMNNRSTSSARGIFIIWLAPRADNINQILCWIGHPSGQDGAILPARDYPPCPARKISLKVI